MNNNDPVTIELFNTVGQKLKTLVNETLPNGRHTLNLNLKSENIPAGNYFVKFTSPDKSIAIQLIVLE